MTLPGISIGYEPFPLSVGAIKKVSAMLRSLIVRSLPLLVLFLLLKSPLAVAAPPSPFAQALVEAAHARTQHRVIYDGSYRKIPYPGGDVPQTVGVCTDVIVRVYRQLGIDLQKEVHEDMRAHFSAYPQNWGLKGPDRNIDHRRVPNLRRFFERKGQSFPVTQTPENYQPGDLVTSLLPGNLPHIMIVSDQRSRDGKRPLVIHNIGRGPKKEDALFAYPLTGHYRYRP